jgi:hypothetical protein
LNDLQFALHNLKKNSRFTIANYGLKLNKIPKFDNLKAKFDTKMPQTAECQFISSHHFIRANSSPKRGCRFVGNVGGTFPLNKWHKFPLSHQMRLAALFALHFPSIHQVFPILSCFCLSAFLPPILRLAFHFWSECVPSADCVSHWLLISLYGTKWARGGMDWIAYMRKGKERGLKINFLWIFGVLRKCKCPL